jgi:hypothetical protein
MRPVERLPSFAVARASRQAYKRYSVLDSGCLRSLGVGSALRSTDFSGLFRALMGGYRY